MSRAQTKVLRLPTKHHSLISRFYLQVKMEKNLKRPNMMITNKNIYKYMNRFLLIEDLSHLQKKQTDTQTRQAHNTLFSSGVKKVIHFYKLKPFHSLFTSHMLPLGFCSVLFFWSNNTNYLVYSGFSSLLIMLFT